MIMLCQDTTHCIFIDLDTDACAICSAIFRQPNRGLRLFISTTAATTSFEGPLGPGRERFPGEYNDRYLQRTNPW